MKKFLIPILFGLLLIACKHNYTEVIQTLHPDGSRQIVYYYEIHNSDSVLKMYREFYPSSSIIRIEGSIKNNERNGLWQSWREDGALWSEGNYLDGKRDGITKVYHENGTIYYSGQYKNDQRVGKWKFFSENGELLKEIDY